MSTIPQKDKKKWTLVNRELVKDDDDSGGDIEQLNIQHIASTESFRKKRKEEKAKHVYIRKTRKVFRNMGLPDKEVEISDTYFIGLIL